MTQNLQERTNMNNSSVVPAGASPAVFNNPEFGSVRVIVRKDNGEPLFCLKDIAICLGYADPTRAVKDICDPQGVCILPAPSEGGVQQVKFGYESEVYRLIFGSKLESAKKFQDWVFKDVLPSIRRTGSYSVVRPSYQIEDPIARAQKWIEEEKERRNLLAENTKQAELIEMNRPKVEAYDGFMATGQNVHIGTFVKSVRDKLPHIKITQDWVFQRLRDAGYLMKDGMRRNLAYAKYCINGGAGYFAIKQSAAGPTTLLTPKGQEWLFNSLKELMNEHANLVQLFEGE